MGYNQIIMVLNLEIQKKIQDINGNPAFAAHEKKAEIEKLIGKTPKESKLMNKLKRKIK